MNEPFKPRHIRQKGPASSGGKALQKNRKIFAIFIQARLRWRMTAHKRLRSTPKAVRSQEPAHGRKSLPQHRRQGSQHRLAVEIDNRLARNRRLMKQLLQSRIIPEQQRLSETPLQLSQLHPNLPDCNST
jgi:hypothetical protein